MNNQPAPSVLPRYPVYIPSKGRADCCLTGLCLAKYGVPFHVVVEPQEQQAYESVFGPGRVLVLPFSNLGQGSIPARNWIKAYSIAAGHARHWQLDDNIRLFYRMWEQKRIPCQAGLALRVCEDFSDRYENVAVSGLNYAMFGCPINGKGLPPFYLNVHVYSCTLVLNSIPHLWRGRYNEDTDLCLQVLADGWCTVLINAFLANKMRTMTMKGGNSDKLYAADGRLRMARSLERAWPGVVEVKRRFKRPQHVVNNQWRKFSTPLKRKAEADISPGVLELGSEYGMKLVKLREPKSERMRKLANAWKGGTSGGQAQPVGPVGPDGEDHGQQAAP